MSDKHKFDSQKFSDDLHNRIHQQANAYLNRGWRPPRQMSGILPGLVLIVLGTIFLLDHMGYIDAQQYWRFWPLILVAVGISKLFLQNARIMGIGLIVIGIVLELHEFHYTKLSWNMIWPFLIIVVGAQMILSRFQFPAIPGVPGSLSSDGRDTINEYAMFGGVERRVGVNNFRGGSVTAIFGGVEVDFRSADIEGEEATVFVEALFGGIEITVPERWLVTFQGQSIFAGYSDETRQPLPEPAGAQPRKTLILRGRAVFGGISVKN